MTNEEAIEMIQNCLGFNNIIMPFSDDMEAFGMAIKALEEQEQNRWIPVSDRLPEESGTYEVTTINGAVLVTHFYSEHKVFSSSRINKLVIAWKTLPEPYKKNNREYR